MAVSGRPDVIILDLGLPDMDGLEVTRRLREWTQIPIIIVSVRDQEEHKIAALDAGADDYLTKPFGVGELTARVRAALRRSRPPGVRAGLPEGRPAGGPGPAECRVTRPARQPDSHRIRYPAPAGPACRESSHPRAVDPFHLGQREQPTTRKIRISCGSMSATCAASSKPIPPGRATS